ncbi:hypothetical protein L541_4384 [Bordetella hinzii CA90 BAL1384]|uniref:Uncharacterized protein n=1 Tax=Bordetella hinzii OH87 BAL007II TaxID=1331262 RepID=A0ABR4R0P6_9BORD|nr:hypothetical protein L544_3653 [Bordetella hinzii OH87 BAL007II]KCB28632.1 hypothetical protein L541_4384 [Bordetella hinzii CA90 BAL1384]KCB43153.1 hypothetical protein L539_1257 [Bordetella hinzii 5132]
MAARGVAKAVRAFTRGGRRGFISGGYKRPRHRSSTPARGCGKLAFCHGRPQA